MTLLSVDKSNIRVVKPAFYVHLGSFCIELLLSTSVVRVINCLLCTDYIHSKTNIKRFYSGIYLLRIIHSLWQQNELVMIDFIYTLSANKEFLLLFSKF
jgi:hypothetical protein